jgi:hypothetical protein
MQSIKYHNIAVKRAWDALSDRGVKIGNLVLTKVGKKKYEQIRARFSASYKGAETMTHVFLQDVIDAVPGFLDEIQQQEILYHNPSNVENVMDAFAKAVMEAMEKGPMMQELTALKEEMKELRAKLNEKGEVAR